MSGRLAYALAVTIMISPFVLIPGFIIYTVHRNHQLEEQFKVQVAAQRALMIAKMDQAEADQRAHQNH